MVDDMVWNMAHNLRNNTVKVQILFMAHTCTKSIQKAQEIMCTETPNSLSPAYQIDGNSHSV